MTALRTGAMGSRPSSTGGLWMQRDRPTVVKLVDQVARHATRLLDLLAPTTNRRKEVADAVRHWHLFPYGFLLADSEKRQSDRIRSLRQLNAAARAASDAARGGPIGAGKLMVCLDRTEELMSAGRKLKGRFSRPGPGVARYEAKSNRWPPAHPSTCRVPAVNASSRRRRADTSMRPGQRWWWIG